MVLQRSIARCALPLGLAVALIGCQPAVVEDLDNFCKVVSEVKGKSGLDTEARLKAIEARKSEYAKVTEEPFAALWASFSSAPIEKRYEVLVQAAKQAGKSDWSCVSFERLVELHKAERAAAEKLAQEKANAAKAASELALGEASQAKKDDSLVREKKKSKKRRARRRH